MSFHATPHPVLGLPTPAQALAMGEKAWRETVGRREAIIAQEKADPFGHLWEPPIWQVCDALMGFPWVEEGWARRMREHLGFSKPTPVTLVLGGNRAGKSQWASNRVVRVLRLKDLARAWALHSTMPMSIQYQQPLLYHYLPPALKASDLKTKTTYVAYKQKTGFSEQQFVLPPKAPGLPGNDCLFKTYDQDMATIEGGNLDIIWPDELVPSDWVETMELRIAERNGWMPITFTPIQGYSPTVGMFLDGAEVVKENVAFLCPKDGGPPDVARALGFTEPGMLEELQQAQRENRAAFYPQSIPQDCHAWLEGKSGQPEVPAGREFEKVPRVLKCQDEEGKRAVVFFHSSDNPYGNPKNVWATIASKPREFIRERFYGVANKVLSARFPKFNRNVHVVRPEDISRDGTNYQLLDPCNGRNFFMHWVRVTPEHVYLYREWPSGFYIPGIGVPGPWALPDGKHPDGKRGPAQKPFGWGLRNYKEELARLEGWKDAENAEGGKQKAESAEAERKAIDEWDEHNGASERVQERFIDSRFASTPKVEKDRPKTLLTEFEEIGLFFTPTPGDDIDEGVELITDALNFDETRPVSYLNQPRLLVSAECVNTIYALCTWTGLTREGRRCLDGATKDPIDLLRYFFLSDCAYTGSGAGEERAEEPSDFEPTPKRYY